MTQSTPQQRAQYLARKIRDQEIELERIRDALRTVLNEWAVAISPYHIGDRVKVIGVPNWDGQVTEIRAAHGAFDIEAESPMIVLMVRYLRKDGTLGKKYAEFRDGYNYNWKLAPLDRPECDASLDI